MIEQQIREAIAADPTNAELYYELAVELYKVKREDGLPYDAHGVSKELKKAIVIDPFNGKYHFLRAEVSAHTSSDDWDDELNCCIRLKYKVKECKAILKTRDQVWKSSFDREGHINKLKEKVKEDPSAENYYQLGLWFRGVGDDSLKYYSKALEIDPTHAASMASLAFYYQDKGMNYEASEWFLKSIEHARTVEDKSTYYNWTAAFYEEIGNHKSAFDIRQKAWNEVGGDYQDLALVGDSYLRMGNYAEAEKAFLEVLKSDPKDGNHHGTYCNLVILYMTINKFDKAKFYFEEGIKRYPDSANFYHYKGLFLLQAGDIESAKKSFSAAVIHEHEYYPSYLTLGNLAFREKDYETALKYYKTVLKYNADVLEAHEALHEIYKILGNEKMVEFHTKKIRNLGIKDLLN